jgi:hypothetical protein
MDAGSRCYDGNLSMPMPQLVKVFLPARRPGAFSLEPEVLDYFKSGAALAVGLCILPRPACAGGHQIPGPRSRQSQFPRELLTALGMLCLTNRAAPSTYLGLR